MVRSTGLVGFEIAFTQYEAHLANLRKV